MSSKFSVAASKQSKDAGGNKGQNRYTAVSARVPPNDVRWTFGFRYFREIEHFGLESKTIKNSWLISVIERFTELGYCTVEDVIGNKDLAKANRCHIINWKQKNIPIQPAALNWLPDAFRATEEYPLIQFAVSKAMGRVIGFFDQNWTFQVVLLDPLHNLQPSGDFGYKVDLCGPLGCELTAFRAKVEAVARSVNACGCGASEQLAQAIALPAFGEAFVFSIHRDDLPQMLDEVLQSELARDIHDVIAAGVDACLERPGKA